MLKHTLKKLPKQTFEVKVTITWDEVAKEYDKAFDALHKELTIEGFRKGKAPKAIAEKHLHKEDIYQQLIKTLLPRIYDEIVKKEDLKPIISPRVELIKAKENEDWEFKITLAERPLIDLGNYKKAVQEAKAKAQKADIWVPGKDKEPAPQQEEAKKQQVMNSVLDALMKATKCEISDLIIEEEQNHRLTQLLDDIQKLGLTADSYLKSKGTTMDELKKKIAKEIEDTYKMEFVLGEIAEKENITVEQKDLESLFTHITNEQERKSAEQNAYFYASILRKQKTLDFLNSL